LIFTFLAVALYAVVQACCALDWALDPPAVMVPLRLGSIWKATSELVAVGLALGRRVAAGRRAAREGEGGDGRDGAQLGDTGELHCESFTLFGNCGPVQGTSRR
jgi:hypothetical protein